jgi:23S rRNA (cytosine1962-C5)-methyltransferase
VPGDVARRLRDGHPFIFAEALRGRTLGQPAGHPVEVVDPDGKFVALAIHDPGNAPLLRVVSRRAGEGFGPAEVAARVAESVALRRRLLDTGPESCHRVVSGDCEGLPAVNVDRYAGYLVVTFTSAVAETYREALLAALDRELGPRGIYLQRRFQAAVPGRARPGAELVAGAAAPPEVLVSEGRARFLVDVSSPGGTGIYPDMRNGRRLVAGLSGGARVLNCFSYTGAFGIWALKGGAKSVQHVESSSDALGLARQHARMNDLAPEAFEYLAGDVFKVLREYRDAARRFDLIILDPPRFVESQSQMERGSRGYKDINLLAFSLLRPGGMLFTFSCSGRMPTDLFQKIVADAALDAGREAQILRRLSQAADHPTSLAFPEGTYLKGFVLRVA